MSIPASSPPSALAHAAATNARRATRGFILALLIGLTAAALLVLTVSAAELGAMGLITGLAFALLPAPVYVAIALLIDRFEPEPLRMLAFTFFWGAAGAVLISLILNTAGGLVIGGALGAEAGQVFGGSVSAPVVEELSKAAVLFGLYLWRRTEFNGVVDGVIYAAMVALGFATAENILYYGRAALDGSLGLTFVVRGLMAPFAHPVFTAMTGIGVGLAAQARSQAQRIVAPVAGLLGAMLLHSIWNTAPLFGELSFFVTYLLVMVPVFGALIGAIVFFRRREVRVVRQYLEPDLGNGLLTGDEIGVFSSARARRHTITAAKRRGGPAGVELAKGFVDSATELAFFRERRARGVTGAIAAEDEGAYIERVRYYRDQLRWHCGSTPPAAPPAAAAAASAGAPSAAPGPSPAPAASSVPAPLASPPSTPPSPVTSSPAAAWYSDPWARHRLRYWDGREWTGYTSD